MHQGLCVIIYIFTLPSWFALLPCLLGEWWKQLPPISCSQQSWLQGAALPSPLPPAFWSSMQQNSLFFCPLFPLEWNSVPSPSSDHCHHCDPAGLWKSDHSGCGSLFSFYHSLSMAVAGLEKGKAGKQMQPGLKVMEMHLNGILMEVSSQQKLSYFRRRLFVYVPVRIGNLVS